jgi:hypothetical protein
MLSPYMQVQSPVGISHPDARYMPPAGWRPTACYFLRSLRERVPSLERHRSLKTRPGWTREVLYVIHV